MVVLHVKRGADGSDSFLYETTCGTSNDALIRELIWIHNARLKLQALAGLLKELAAQGPVVSSLPEGAKADGTDGTTGSSSGDGVDEAQAALAAASLTDGVAAAAAAASAATTTTTIERVGAPPDDARAVETLEKVAADIEAYVSKEQVGRKVAMRSELLREKLDNARGAVAMAYPLGLPAHDPVHRIFEATEEQEDEEDAAAATAALQGMQFAAELLDPATTELWATGRAFERGQTVGERLGTRNEKTKVVARLQRPNQGPPPREPVVSEAERQAMMAFYFKRQEEMKRLAEANDDDYLHSTWADGKSLQRNLRGVTDVKAPGLLPSSSSSSSTRR